VARDGAQALEYVFSDPNAILNPPSLILLDLQLPKVDGLEVLAQEYGPTNGPGTFLLSS